MSTLQPSEPDTGDGCPARLAASYLAVQAAAGVAWWGWMLALPEARGWFLPAGWPPAVLSAFGLADGALLVAGSALAALGLWRRAGWAPPVLWLTAGGVGYAALYCLGAALVAGSGWAAAATMLPAAALTSAIAWRHGRRGESRE